MIDYATEERQAFIKDPYIVNRKKAIDTLKACGKHVLTCHDFHPTPASATDTLSTIRAARKRLEREERAKRRRAAAEAKRQAV